MEQKLIGLVVRLIITFVFGTIPQVWFYFWYVKHVTEGNQTLIFLMQVTLALFQALGYTRAIFWDRFNKEG